MLNQQHVEQYRSLRLESLQESPLAFSDSYEDLAEWPHEAFAKELEWRGTPPECFVLAAMQNKRPVGFLRFQRDVRSKGRHKAYVHSMYVQPAHRKQGLGRHMLGYLQHHAPELKGLEQIHLWVLHSHTSATGFYQSCGYQSQGTRVKNDLKIGDTYVDAEYMVLELASAPQYPAKAHE